MLARDLCVRAGNTPETCDELVYRTEPFRINTPQGIVYGGILQDMRPLWMLWLHEAMMTRQMAREMAQEMAGRSN